MIVLQPAPPPTRTTTTRNRAKQFHSRVLERHHLRLGHRHRHLLHGRGDAVRVPVHFCGVRLAVLDGGQDIGNALDGPIRPEPDGPVV